MKAMAWAVLCVGLSMWSPAARAQDSGKAAAPKSVTVDIINAAGESVGTAYLSEAPQGVRIRLEIRKLPAGHHLMHIHQFPKCDPPDFKSAGPHFMGAMSGEDHAAMSPGGLALGDIPHFELDVESNGTAHVTTIAPNVTLGPGDHSVFSNGGTAIVIHEVATQVTENAPPRIACGVISKPK
jgi:Cu-Zn family superoxide dismutase